MKRLIVFLLALSLVAAACNRGSETTTAPTVPPDTSTVATEATETTTAPETTVVTTTTLAPSVIDLEYQVMFKGITDGKSVVVLLIDEGTATDIALESLALEALDEFDPLSELFVVDVEEAVTLVRLDPTSLTDEEAEILSEHYLLNVKEAVLTFKGPFADLGGYTLGS